MKTIAEKLTEKAEKEGFANTLSLFRMPIKAEIPLTTESLNKEIEELNLSVRSRNGLMRHGIDTVRKAVEQIMSEKGFENVRNLGKKSISEIKTSLIAYAYQNLSDKRKTEFWNFILENNSLDKTDL